MEKLRLFLVISLFALLVAGCGNDGSSTSNVTPTQPVSVSLSDLSATVEISKTYQFDATVENADDTSVDWQVNKVSGGSSTVGTISDSGLYTAPDRVPSPITVTVTAVAHADATKEASATVTIMSNVTVAVSPEDTTLPAGETLQFTAAIEYAQDTAAKWTVNDVPGGDTTVGTISAGLYTAPALPPPGGVATITAISLADTSKTDSVNVTVQFSNASVSGPYVFSFSGKDPDAPYYVAGRFVADGNGNIVSFDQDFRKGGLSQQMSSTGTYAVQPDGRGTLTLSFEGMSEPSVAIFQMTSSGEGPIIQFTNSLTGSGQFYKQDADTFSNASMTGSYVLQVLGSESSGTTGAGVGVITCDGAGSFAGIEDMNTGSSLITKFPISGSYSVGANGRTVVTAVVDSETSENALYLISSNRAVGVPLGAGSGGALMWVEKQQIINFSNASFSGDFVYVATGDPATDRNVSHGRFTANGAGAISAGTLSQHYGNIQTFRDAFTGSYSIPGADHGRGTASLTTSTGTVNFVFYPVSDKKAFLIGTDTSPAKGGQLLAQQGAPFHSSSYYGAYVFSLRGFDSLGELSVVGTITISDDGVPSGTVDINHAGTLSRNVPLVGDYDLWDTSGFGYLETSAGGNLWFLSVLAVDPSKALVSVAIVEDEFLFGSVVKRY